MNGQFFVQPGGSVIAYEVSGTTVATGAGEVWAIQNLLPASGRQ